MKVNKFVIIAAICAIVIVAGAAIYVTGQGSDGESNPPETDTPDVPDVPIIPDNPDTSSSLVVYFSLTGNTENVAEEIQRQTGADIFEIIPEQAYPSVYNEVLAVARAERNDNARPVIDNLLSTDDMNKYDVIYLGFPIWYNDVPMIICTFLDQYDLSGKIIMPFCTSGSTGISGAVQTINNIEPDADVRNGLRFGSSNIESAVSNWLGSLQSS